MLIGVLMGPLLETYLLRALRIGQGDPMILFSSTLGNVLWVMVVAGAAAAVAQVTPEGGRARPLGPGGLRELSPKRWRRRPRRPPPSRTSVQSASRL